MGMSRSIGIGIPSGELINNFTPAETCFIITELDEFCEQEVGAFRMIPETCP